MSGMEALLLAGDDSSSGESDTEVAVVPGGSSAVAAAAVPAAPSPAPPAAPVAEPAPAAASQQQANMSSSEMSARLKSMYSPAKSKPVSSGIPHQQLPPAPQQQTAHHAPQPSSRPAVNPPMARPGGSIAHRGGVVHQQQPQQPSSSGATSSQTSRSTQQQHHHPSVSRSSAVPQPVPPQGRGRSNDPYEPTPVAKILERQQHKLARQGVSTLPPASHARPPPQAAMPSGQRGHGYPPPQQQHQQRQLDSSSGSKSGHHSTSSTATLPISNVSAGAAERVERSKDAERKRVMDRATYEAQEKKKRKERFLIFTRVLMKYLEQKDPPVHQKVKAIIKDCAERNRRREPGYESVTDSMRSRLKEVVNDNYWKRAEAYLAHFLTQKSKASAKEGDRTSAEKLRQIQGQQPSSSSSRVSSSSMSSKQQQQQQQHQQQQQQSSSSSSSSTVKRTSHPVTAETLANIQRDKQRALAEKGASSSNASNKYTPTSASAASTQSYGGGGKGGKGSSAAANKGGRGATKGQPVLPSPLQQRKTSTTGSVIDSSKSAEPREYSKFMEMVDHAVNFDWTTAGLILGQKTFSHLSEEQRNLLYSEAAPATALQEPELLKPSFPMRGWGDRNVISPRVAWARARLPEQMSAKTETFSSTTVARPETADKPTAWFNEDTAEDDLALAVLSEGAQIYLKSVLEKAVHCARQRLNVDGIRLYHEQLIPGNRPPLSLRLGCDVSRQEARASGNAAMTCKRMEEALERQDDVPAKDRSLDYDTLVDAQSMSDLALRPLLARGAEGAEYEAKRCFELYGGKDSTEAPLGRVPKKAKIEIVDFQTGMSFSANRRQRASAGTVSASFFY